MARWLSCTAATVAVLAATLWSSPAFAADGLDIDHVEASAGTVSVVVAVDGLPAGTEVDPAELDVSVNDAVVTIDAAETIESGQIERTTILALDASRSMAGEPFAAAKEAADAFLAAAPEDVEIGLVTFAGKVTTLSEPTTDHASLSRALDGIKLSLGTALYDGIVQSVDLSGSQGARSVLVLSDGRDKGSSASLEEAVSAARDAGIVVDVVALDQRPEDRALLSQIADSSGGQVIEATSPESLGQVFRDQADALAHQILVRFEQPTDAGVDTTIEVSLSAAGQTFVDSALVTLVPADAGVPEVIDTSGNGPGTIALMIGGAALCLGLAIILAIIFLGDRGPSRAQRQLSEYLGTADPGVGVTTKPIPASSQATLRESALALSERVIKGDLESRLNGHLMGGGLALTPAEWLLIHAGVTVAAGFIGLVLGGGPAMLMGLLVGLSLPWVYLRRKHSRRLAAFNAQLAETLDLIAGGLAAGLSLPQAVDTVVREGAEPMAGELRRALIEQRLGVSVEDALDGVATRMDSKDFGWVVMAIRIQREVGGNLAELLRTVSDTLREREYLRRQVKVLSAEGRFSGYVLGALPIVMFGYMLLIRPEYVQVLYTTGIGLIMLAASVVLLAAGFWTMSRIVKIEV